MSEAFLSRWSRLKKTGGDVAPPVPVSAPEIEKTEKPAAQNAPLSEQSSENLETKLPAIETLTADSDFTAFMQPKVPDSLKRQALKKLFSNPQFNVMDGLDVYVDDYSVSVPIPDDWYKDIPSWQAMLNPKPPMVVTAGGYAVEADSEEGVAILKARAEAELLPASPVESPEASLKSLSHVEHGSADPSPLQTPETPAQALTPNPLPEGEGLQSKQEN